MAPLPHAADPDQGQALERQRIEALYTRLPSAIASILIGVLLVFVFMLPVSPPELLKAWAAYMLTTLALRGWLWSQFRSAIIADGQWRRWEWANAVGMGLTGLGWAMLCGPLFPSQPDLQNFIWVMVIMIAYTGMILASTSHISFALFVVPTMGPALWRFTQISDYSVPAVVTAAGCLAVLMVMHQAMRNLLLQHLRKQVEAEQLLAEQSAIFQSATIGIGVYDGARLVKCNPRFGEIFGRTLQAAEQLPAYDLFAVPEEAQRFTAWAQGEFEAARTARSMERLRRADGSQFWAELSGRRMYYGELVRDLWLISEAPVQSAATPRPPA